MTEDAVSHYKGVQACRAAGMTDREIARSLIIGMIPGEEFAAYETLDPPPSLEDVLARGLRHVHKLAPALREFALQHYLRDVEAHGGDASSLPT